MAVASSLTPIRLRRSLQKITWSRKRTSSTVVGGPMQVRDGMSDVVLTVGPGHTLRQAAQLMAKRKVGAAVVLDPESEGPGILTERDILLSLAEGQDPEQEMV